MSTNHVDINSAPAPCVMVIFGITGDLIKRKLIPALINLAQENLLSKQFAIVGFAMNDAAGSWGPVEAEELFFRDGRSWRRIGEEELDLHGPHALQNKDKVGTP